MPTDSKKCPYIYFLIKVNLKYSYKQENMEFLLAMMRVLAPWTTHA